jgi:hypothetical protein
MSTTAMATHITAAKHMINNTEGVMIDIFGEGFGPNPFTVTEFSVVLFNGVSVTSYVAAVSADVVSSHFSSKIFHVSPAPSSGRSHSNVTFFLVCACSTL